MNIFSRKLVKIPRPKFIVFYNGLETQPDYQEMRLSDSFIKSDKDNEKDMLELVCKVYNINEGRNKKLLSKCKWLSDYMIFVDKVREYHQNHSDEELHQDIEKAIDYCIKNNILKEFLKKRRSRRNAPRQSIKKRHMCGAFFLSCLLYVAVYTHRLLL